MPLALLPESLEKTIGLAENSEIVKDEVGEELLTKYIALKKKKRRHLRRQKT